QQKSVNPLTIVGNQQQQIASYMQNNTSSQTAANVPTGSSTQGTIAVNQQHGIVSLGSDDDDLWSFMSAFDNKRGHQDGQSSSMAKKKHLNPLAGSSNNTLIQQQSTGGVIQHPNNAITPTQTQHHYQMLDAISSKPNVGKQGIRHNIKQEPLEIGRDSDRLHPKDDEPVQRRSSSRPPKSRESSSGAARRQYRAAPRSSSVHAVGGSRTSSSNTNNSMHPTQMAATSRSKPFPTIRILSGIRSSSNTIGNTSGLSNVSASVKREIDRRTHDRFTKIGLLTARYNLNCKELKVDDY
nr:hypothetical protein [Tanacetum cinerariifolium]